ncbi:hypothetical protein CDD80_2983 [Ophiocordyceps camponoti-rufipedis]|uniref:Uncharacterized protein n=1 Tax=Ophiocordyceps camponoti-rufipedis TaxID=2004952 RepID=A0A2C5Z3Z9_9HYPO|nr:hypothetical protein CDD80_2983 [Ophiocordyceps camponoti-rufipedis]
MSEPVDNPPPSDNNSPAIPERNTARRRFRSYSDGHDPPPDWEPYVRPPNPAPPSSSSEDEAPETNGANANRRLPSRNSQTHQGRGQRSNPFLDRHGPIANGVSMSSSQSNGHGSSPVGHAHPPSASESSTAQRSGAPSPYPPPFANGSHQNNGPREAVNGTSQGSRPYEGVVVVSSPINFVPRPPTTQNPLNGHRAHASQPLPNGHRSPSMQNPLNGHRAHASQPLLNGHRSPPTPTPSPPSHLAHLVRPGDHPPPQPVQTRGHLPANQSRHSSRTASLPDQGFPRTRFLSRSAGEVEPRTPPGQMSPPLGSSGARTEELVRLLRYRELYRERRGEQRGDAQVSEGQSSSSGLPRSMPGLPSGDMFIAWPGRLSSPDLPPRPSVDEGYHSRVASSDARQAAANNASPQNTPSPFQQLMPHAIPQGDGASASQNLGPADYRGIAMRLLSASQQNRSNAQLHINRHRRALSERIVLPSSNPPWTPPPPYNEALADPPAAPGLMFPSTSSWGRLFRGQALRAFWNVREQAMEDRSDLDGLSLLRESAEARQTMSLEQRLNAALDVVTGIARRQVDREYVVWSHLISLFDWIDM